MNDSQFAVLVALLLVLVSGTAGAASVWVAMQGPHECSVTFSDSVGNKHEVITTCVS